MSDFELYSRILDGLSTILGIPYEKIDLSDLDNANILLRYEITLKGKLLYGAGKLNDLERILISKRQKMISDALTEIKSR